MVNRGAAQKTSYLKKGGYWLQLPGERTDTDNYYLEKGQILTTITWRKDGYWPLLPVKRTATDHYYVYKGRVLTTTTCKKARCRPLLPVERLSLRLRPRRRGDCSRATPPRPPGTPSHWWFCARPPATQINHAKIIIKI